MIKIASALLAAGLMVGGTAPSFAQTATSVAQSDNHPASSAVDPYEPHDLPNGDRSPAPALRANGGVSPTEIPFDSAQTRSGGPVGGNVTQEGGG